MTSSTATSYGTWCTRVNGLSTSPDADVVDYVGTGSPDWVRRVQDSGALARMKADYRDAINAALPPDIALCGDTFIGPAEPEPDAFDGYPTVDGFLDFAAMVQEIDLDAIVDRHDPDA
ncbi:hypothetical protein [Streptomyces longispororuber]|uniref:hypothetical protein n=1 Tax=Streptomyces longispororuber TaxID=68230 RepID=UPI0036FDD039